MNPDLKLNPEHQAVFDSIPADSPRSRLDPYRALILRWRGQGRTYEKISQLLSEKFGVQIAYGPLYRFVQRHSRPCKPAQPELEAQTVAPTPANNDSGQTVETVAPKPRRTPEEIAALREAARARNHQPAFQSKPDELPVFHYDSSKPPINKNYL